MEKHSINMEEHSINIFVKSDKYILGRIKYINLIDKLSKPDCQRSIDLEVSGGTLPYQYLWSNGSTVPEITDLLT